jgi:hypothetical protein
MSYAAAPAGRVAFKRDNGELSQSLQSGFSSHPSESIAGPENRTSVQNHQAISAVFKECEKGA